MFQPMDRDKFYELIDKARKDPSLQAPSVESDKLAKVLTNLTPEDATAFVLRYDEEEIALTRWDIWGVGYLMEGGMSDDGFDYFKPWIIGKGKNAVDLILSDPDNLPSLLPEDWEEGELENEELLSVVSEILEERELPDPRYTPERRVIVGGREPKGEIFDEESLYELYPNTAAYLSSSRD